MCEHAKIDLTPLDVIRGGRARTEVEVADCAARVRVWLETRDEATEQIKTLVPLMSSVATLDPERRGLLLRDATKMLEACRDFCVVREAYTLKGLVHACSV
jgi:hypothetical protein